MDRRRLSLLLALSLGLVGIGTAGYRLLEGWSWLDCVFMTVMTLTTVGYGSPGPLHTAGKVFSVLLMLVGIGLMLYVLTLLAATVVRGLTDPASMRRRKERIHLIRNPAGSKTGPSGLGELRSRASTRKYRTGWVERHADLFTACPRIAEVRY